MKRFIMVAILCALNFLAGSALANPIYSGPEDDYAIHHVVRPGDNLWRITRSYTPQLVERLREENPEIGPRGLIYPNQYIKLPTSWFDSVPPAQSPTTVVTTTKENSNMFDHRLFLTLLAFVGVIGVIGGFIALIIAVMRRPAAVPPSAPVVIYPPYPPTAPMVPDEVHIYVHHIHMRRSEGNAPTAPTTS